jgi:hypothetical protein|nr:MAG TPA_asm: hypothetical protein [Caudoviricetes sp.]
MDRLEEARREFLKVRGFLLENSEFFALAKAYKKPWKWYREHTTQEAVSILRAEAKAN